ncbi:hypothetical protein ANTQUA_LOCUS9319 [Anthophora quadrimaculata]
MSKASGMLETEDVVGKSTLDGRVSDILKDGSYSGPPMLFHHESMQKIRHCCQNLNLFPYLLYSFDNSKSHPIVRKVHLCLAVYFALVFLAFQLVGLFSLMVIGKYTPGFIFLVSSLMFLSYITLKVFFHESVTLNDKSRKIKAEE